MSDDLEQLRADLLALDTELRRGLTFAVVAVAQEVKVAAKTHEFQNKTGATEGAVPDPVLKETMKGAEATILVTDANALRMQFGTRAHEIFPRGGLQAAAAVKSHKVGETQRASGGVLRFEVGGEARFARYVRHPGTRAYDWLGKAADAAEEKIDALVQTAIDAALSK
jgi:hypothetical protein